MVFDKIREIVALQMEVPETKIVMETEFDRDLNADSLDVFQIIAEAEDAFGMEFETNASHKIKTVGDAVRYIENER